MKGRSLFLIVFLFFSLYSFSQEDSNQFDKFSFSIKGGYTFPVSKSTVGSPKFEVGNRLLVSNENGEYQFSEKNPFGTRGAGYQIAGSFMYKFSTHFGIEMEFSFLRSSKILDAKRDETDIENKNYFAEQHSYTNMLRAAPMLVVTGDPTKKFTPYAKFGILLPLAGKTIVEVNINDQTGEMVDNLMPLLNKEVADSLEAKGLDIGIPSTSYIKAKTAGSFSLGFASRIGCMYNINDKWSLFGEMEMNMLTIKAKETKFVDFSAVVPEDIAILAQTLLEIDNIQNEYGIYDIPEILRLTVYQNEITEESNTEYNFARKDEPLEQVTFRDNYNSFGFMLGFTYRFGAN